MERRTVPLQSKPIAIIDTGKDDDYGQGFDSVAAEKACKVSFDKHRIPDGIGLLIWVAKQMAIPGMLEAAVLLICVGARIFWVVLSPNLHRRRSDLAARGNAELVPHKSFHVRMSNLAERKVHLQKAMVVAQGSQNATWLTIANNEWA